MALTATMRRFDIALADADRGVFADLDLRVAQHPSESERYLVARVLARTLEHADGVEFSRGLAADDEPALWQHDLRGDLTAWIEVGSPAPERLHKACKSGARVAVYAWKAPDELAALLVERDIFRAREVEVYALDLALLDAVAATLERTNRWELSVSGGTLYLTAAGQLLSGEVRRVS